MSNFYPWSHSAPTVTQEELDAEQKAFSREEWKQIQDDIYGKYEPILETPQTIADKIREMREYVDAIDDDEKESYLVAQEKCPHYCNSEDFQLMFLRREKFDAEKAAARLVAYWEDKLDIFGPEHTYHRISIDDILADPEDAYLLKSGAYYILPQKDEAGRGIIFQNRAKTTQRQFSRQSKLRVVFYLLHCTLDDDEITQKKGFIVMFSPPESIEIITGFDRKCAKRMYNFGKVTFPGRLAANHGVVPAVSFVNLIFLPVLYHLLGKEMRNRFVSHPYHQSPKETAASFKEYGIKERDLPIQLGGSVDFDYDAFLEQRRAIEEAR